MAISRLDSEFVSHGWRPKLRCKKCRHPVSNRITNRQSYHGTALGYFHMSCEAGKHKPPRTRKRRNTGGEEFPVDIDVRGIVLASSLLHSYDDREPTY